MLANEEVLAEILANVQRRSLLAKEVLAQVVLAEILAETLVAETVELLRITKDFLGFLNFYNAF